MKKNKKDNYIKLCFKYNFNCNSCPRNRKCSEELEKEEEQSIKEKRR